MHYAFAALRLLTISSQTGTGTYVPDKGPTAEAMYDHAGLNIFEIDALDSIRNTEIVIDAHCFGCTAGKGSSCGGAVVE